MKLSIAFFGSSLVSAYWNGAATYYRGVLQALAARGHRIAFYEPDPPQGFDLSSSNDVTIDDRGLCYLIDRQRGVDIIETSVL